MSFGKGFSVYHAQLRSAAAVVLVIAATLLFGCATSSTEKGYSAYFVQTLNQLAEPSLKYILQNADRIVHTNSEIAANIFVEFESSRVSESIPTQSLEAFAALVRNADGSSLRFGSSESCNYLVIRSDGMSRCDKSIFTEYFKLLD